MKVEQMALNESAIEYAARLLWHMNEGRVSIDLVNFIGTELLDASLRALVNDVGAGVINPEDAADFRSSWKQRFQSLMEMARKGEPPFTL